jgi:hypothetical protein
MRFGGPGAEGERHFFSGASRLVSGENGFQNGAAILTGHKRLKIQPDTIDKMSHLLWENRNSRLPRKS